MTIAIVGATGLVGRTMIQVLEERDIHVDRLVLLASKRTAGSEMMYKGEKYHVGELTERSFEGIDIALFSAGGSVSRMYAPIAAAAGCVVIDNSSTWRMDENVPLVVPEVNASDATSHHGIIANPNCSTIQLVVALKPLHDAFGLKRVLVSTYQSPSGAGQNGVDQLKTEEAGGTVSNGIAPFPIAHNTVFHQFAGDAAITEEEAKMQRETKRILHLEDLAIAVTCVRVPVLGGHGESVAVELDRVVTVDNVRAVLQTAPGIVLLDDPSANVYPTTQQAEGKDEVFVGRIRKDPSCENGILLWVVADNLRKGAATNAVQILESIVSHAH